MTPENPVHVILPKKYFSVTVFGAISKNLQGSCYFSLGRSTCAEDFKTFLRELKTRVRPDYPRGRGNISPVLILDNASAHKSHLSTRLLETLFSPYFQPPYSSQFNSIEW